jgi:tRNA/tmRNA/rRNA uracil-C5-methylase (TrmA/RlmC/RlmD family)
MKTRKPEPKNEFLEVTIEKIVPNGYGIGHVDGLTLLVPLVVAGDTVRVSTGKRNGNLVFAQVEKILESSPLRIEPGCKYFGKCGGCNFQQMPYEEQLKAKVGIIEDCLHRIAKMEEPPQIDITGSEPWRYRARANWHADTVNKKIGYFYRNSNKVCEIDDCPILIEPLQKELQGLRDHLNWEELWNNMVHIDAASAGDQVSINSTESNENPTEITFESNGFRFAYNARVFFQGNPYVTPKLIEAAVKDVSGKLALDLYCGVGLFSLPLAKNFSKVIGIESNDESIDFAEINAKRNGLGNLEFHSADVGPWLRENISQLEGLDMLLLDPPRIGVEKDVIKSINEVSPKEIVYVSCDPATLARDLRALFEKYELISIEAFDMFPQTHHVETIARLKLIHYPQ